jgi:hypothetical protein
MAFEHTGHQIGHRMLVEISGQVADPDLVMGISLASKERGRRSGVFVADPRPRTLQLIACGRCQPEQGERTAGAGSGFDAVGELPPFVGQRPPIATLHFAVNQQAPEGLEMWVDAQCLFEIADRHLVAIEVQESHPAIVKRLGEVWPERQCPAVARQRLLRALQLLERIATVA